MEKNKKYTVYFVDDDPFYRNTMENSLQNDLQNKINLRSFPTGEECMAEMESFPPNIVILDYHLSSFNKEALNGIKILNKIKVFNKDIPVIMLSGQEKIELAVKAVKSGAYDYVIKNTSALPRLKHLVGTIIYTINLKKKMNRFENWNILWATMFLIFAIAMTFYIWRHYYN